MPTSPLQWRHNGRNGVSNHRRLDCSTNRLFWRRSKKTPKLSVTGLCETNSPVTGGFPAQRFSNEENVSIWCRHHGVETGIARPYDATLATSVGYWNIGYLSEIHLKSNPAKWKAIWLSWHYDGSILYNVKIWITIHNVIWIGIFQNCMCWPRRCL